MIDIVPSLLGLFIFGLTGVIWILRRFTLDALDLIARRLDENTRAIAELRENRIEVRIHRPASDPEPSAIVMRDEPTKPTDLPRATARTRSKP